MSAETYWVQCPSFDSDRNMYLDKGGRRDSYALSDLMAFIRLTAYGWVFHIRVEKDDTTGWLEVYDFPCGSDEEAAKKYAETLWRLSQ